MVRERGFEDFRDVVRNSSFADVPELASRNPREHVQIASSGKERLAGEHFRQDDADREKITSRIDLAAENKIDLAEFAAALKQAGTLAKQVAAIREGG